MSLFTQLPDELGINCLIRCPRSLHFTMRLVCRAWRDMLSSAAFLEARKAQSLTEPWFYFCLAGKCAGEKEGVRFFVWDPRSRVRVLRSLPSPDSELMTGEEGWSIGARNMGFAAVGAKMYMIGGSVGRREYSDVCAYNPQWNRWERRAPLQRPGSGVSCAVVGNSIFVASQDRDNEETVVYKAEVYSIEEDLWRPLPQPTFTASLLPGVGFGGEALLGYRLDEEGGVHSAAVIAYDPMLQIWKDMQTKFSRLLGHGAWAMLGCKGIVMLEFPPVGQQGRRDSSAQCCKFLYMEEGLAEWERLPVRGPKVTSRLFDKCLASYSLVTSGGAIFLVRAKRRLIEYAVVDVGCPSEPWIDEYRVGDSPKKLVRIPSQSAGLSSGPHPYSLTGKPGQPPYNLTELEDDEDDFSSYRVLRWLNFAEVKRRGETWKIESLLFCCVLEV